MARQNGFCLKMPCQILQNGLLTRILSTFVASLLLSAAPAQDLPALGQRQQLFRLRFARPNRRRPAGQKYFHFSIQRRLAPCKWSPTARMGRTKTEMENVLKTAGWSPNELNESYRDLNRLADRAAGCDAGNRQFHLVSGWHPVETGLHCRQQKLFQSRIGGRGLPESEIGGHHQQLGREKYAWKNWRRGFVSIPAADEAGAGRRDLFQRQMGKAVYEGSDQPRDFHLPDGGTNKHR